MHIHFKQSRLTGLNEAISLAVVLKAYNSVEKCDKELHGHFLVVLTMQMITCKERIHYIH